jgi:hypothetical protein
MNWPVLATGLFLCATARRMSFAFGQLRAAAPKPHAIWLMAGGGRAISCFANVA